MLDPDGAYDSPIEAELAWELGKWLADSVGVTQQEVFETSAGRFRPDFVLRTGLRSVGVEADGRDFHNERRDEWRDAMLLGEGRLDTIYRLRGTDIAHRLPDCLYLMTRLDPELFSERGRINLANAASYEARDKVIDDVLEAVRVVYEAPLDEEGPPAFLRMIRRTSQPTSAKRVFWRDTCYPFAKAQPGLSLDEIIRLYIDSPGLEPGELLRA